MIYSFFALKMLVFNLITWVRFDNVECETNVDHTGICYTNSECKALGGINAGSCAAGKHIQGTKSVLQNCYYRFWCLLCDFIELHESDIRK